MNGQTGDPVVVRVEGDQIVLAPGQDAARLVSCAGRRIRLLFEAAGTWSVAPWEGPALHRFASGGAFELGCAGAHALVGWREDHLTRVARIDDTGLATPVAIASVLPAVWSRPSSSRSGYGCGSRQPADAVGPSTCRPPRPRPARGPPLASCTSTCSAQARPKCVSWHPESPPPAALGRTPPSWETPCSG